MIAAEGGTGAPPEDSLCFTLHLFLTTPDCSSQAMGDQTIQPTPESPEIIAFATRMYDAARQGDMLIFEQALPAGLPPNMTNDKGDSLVRSSPGVTTACYLSLPNLTSNS